MREPLNHPVASLLASVMLALLPVAALSGCSNEASDSSSGVNPVRQQLITSETIAGLRTGEQFVVDDRTQGRVYQFDFSKAPIDFTRITLLSEHGQAMSMDKWLRAARQKGYDLLATPAHSFRLSSSANAFENLTPAEQAQLQSTGRLVKKAGSSAPKAGTVSAQYLQCVTEYYFIDICDADGNNCHVVEYPYTYCYEVDIELEP